MRISAKTRSILAIASFLIYAIIVVFATHKFPSSWKIEAELGIPAAISNVVYGFPLGLIDSAVLDEFNRAFATEGNGPKLVEEAVATTAGGNLPQGTVVETIDGVGIGQQVFFDAAMRLFGLHLSSIVYLFLLLLGLSTVAFIRRYDDVRLFYVPLQYTVLTCMLLTPLLTSPAVRDQAPIGGNRFFGILGILAALHIFFEFADNENPRNGGGRKYWFPLAIQSSVLALVILVRSANAYMLAPIIYAGIASICRKKRNPAQRQSIYWKISTAMAFAIIFTSILVACVPNYVKAGRIGGLFWHRAFVSYFLHPQWPFGDLRQVYDCTKYIPEGLQNTGNIDRNGHCVWWAYPPNQARAESVVQGLTYGSEYEAVLRSAYFYVLFNYPRQVIELYVYYKPLQLIATLRAALSLSVGDVPLEMLVLMALQIMLFLSFVLIDGQTSPLPMMNSFFPPLLLFSLFSLAPPLVAWPSLATSADLVFYMYAMFALVLASGVRMLFSSIRRNTARQTLINSRSQSGH